jgi:hypothetical protein
MSGFPFPYSHRGRRYAIVRTPVSCGVFVYAAYLEGSGYTRDCRDESEAHVEARHCINSDLSLRWRGDFKPRYRIRKCKECHKPFCSGVGFFLRDYCHECTGKIVTSVRDLFPHYWDV